MNRGTEDEVKFLSKNTIFTTKSSKNAIPIGSITLALPPSCIEFVPVSPTTPWAAEEPMFVVGTYDLQKEEQNDHEDVDEASPAVKEQSRQGSLTLYRLKDDIL
jgi:hypothetical protein